MSVDDFCFDSKTESFDDWVKKENIKKEDIESLRLAFIAGYDEGKNCRDRYNYYKLNQK
jgi:hypothetical protein